MALSDDLAGLIDFVLSLRADRVRMLLGRYEIPRSGPKRELRERLVGAAEEGAITAEEIASFLEEVEPWGNQHVYLYDVNSSLSQKWTSSETIRAELEGIDGVSELLEEAPLLILPEELTLASISLSPDLVEVRAVEGREYTERVPDLDTEREVRGTTVEYRAYTRRIARGLLILRWNLGTSQATLHISKAHRGYEYEGAEDQFAELIEDWLDFEGKFSRLQLRKAIEKLSQRERDGGTPLTRSPKVGLQSAGGREIDITSADSHTPAAGEKVIDLSVNEIAKHSRGRLGNVFWLDQSVAPDGANPLEKELHTMILAVDSRIHFMSPSDQESVEYVLRNVRSLC